jgi:hypothetical protein
VHSVFTLFNYFGGKYYVAVEAWHVCFAHAVHCMYQFRQLTLYLGIFSQNQRCELTNVAQHRICWMLPVNPKRAAGQAPARKANVAFGHCHYARFLHAVMVAVLLLNQG